MYVLYVCMYRGTRYDRINGDRRLLQRVEVDMMRSPSSLQFVFPLHQQSKISKMGEGKKELAKLTFSFKCNTNTIIPSTPILPSTTTVTQGIHSPGLKYNSLLHAACPSALPLTGGIITTFEFGITPSILMKCSVVCLVEPTKRFSM